MENDARNSVLQDPARGWTLRQRLLLIITVALLPIALVSVMQGVARARSDIADIADHLVQSARASAEGEQSLLVSGEQILRAVGIQDRDRRLRESVNLKTTLIKEIHHRVKNNLQIVMSLAEDAPGSLRLSIADDGVGFAMDETGKSVGSRLIRTFGTQLGGVSSVRSVEGQGTVVDLVFPDPALKDSV